jgi:hypothetical protein
MRAERERVTEMSGTSHTEKMGDSRHADAGNAAINLQATDALSRERAEGAATSRLSGSVWLFGLFVLAFVLIPVMLAFSSGETIDQLARTGLLLNSYGMSIATLTMIFGAWMLAASVQSDTTIETAIPLGRTGTKVDVKVTTAACGLVVMLAGMVLVVFALYRQWIYVEYGGSAQNKSEALVNPDKTVDINGIRIPLPDFKDGRAEASSKKAKKRKQSAVPGSTQQEQAR